MVIMPTGAGKSLCSSQLALFPQGQPSLFLRYALENQVDVIRGISSSDKIACS